MENIIYLFAFFGGNILHYFAYVRFSIIFHWKHPSMEISNETKRQDTNSHSRFGRFWIYFRSLKRKCHKDVKSIERWSRNNVHENNNNSDTSTNTPRLMKIPKCNKNWIFIMYTQTTNVWPYAKSDMAWCVVVMVVVKTSFMF